MKLLDVPYIKQRPELPSGCEVTALAMALAYYGEAADKLSLAREMPMDDTSVERNEDGINSHMGLLRSRWICRSIDSIMALQLILSETSRDKYRSGSLALYGEAFEVIETHVANKRRISLVYNSSRDAPSTYWHTPAGKVVQAPRPLHCIVVTGTDDDYVYFHDCESTDKSGEHIKNEKAHFTRIYDAMGRRALVIT